MFLEPMGAGAVRAVLKMKLAVAPGCKGWRSFREVGTRVRAAAGSGTGVGIRIGIEILIGSRAAWRNRHAEAR